MGLGSIVGHWAISSTVQTAIMVAGLTGFTAMAGRHLAPRWAVGLWLLVVVRLVVPWSPSVPAALYPWTVAAAWVGLSVPLTPAAGAVSGLPEGARPLAPVAPVSWPADHWFALAAAVWGLAALSLALRFALREWRFRQWVAQAPGRPDLAMSFPADVRETPAVSTPAVFGLRRPQILVPPGLAERLSTWQWHMVLQHELSHIRCRDLWVRWAMEGLCIVYWFNPFVWIARRRIREAQELAADDAVLQSLSPESRATTGLCCWTWRPLAMRAAAWRPWRARCCAGHPWHGGFGVFADTRTALRSAAPRPGQSVLLWRWPFRRRLWPPMVPRPHWRPSRYRPPNRPARRSPRDRKHFMRQPFPARSPGSCPKSTRGNTSSG